MSSAEQLLQLISSWMQQQELCEKQLRMLAGQLENRRQSRLHRGVSVLKPALEGIGFMVVLLLTVVTFGAFYPVLNVTTEICTKKKKPKPAELFLKDRQNVEKRSTDITAEIHRLLEELKTDAKEGGSCSEPDQVDQYVMTKVLTALARQSGLKGRVRIRFSPEEPQIFMETTALIGGPAVMVAVAGMLAFFTFQVSGQKLKPLFDEGLQQLIKQMSTTGCNAEQVGGATGMAANLQQATDTWTGMIQKNQVTEASQSLRDTADMMQRIIKTLRQQFNDIKRTLDKSAKQFKEQPKKLNKNKEEKPGNQKGVFNVTVCSKHSVNASQKDGARDQTEGRRHEQSSRTNRDRSRKEETEQTGGHPGDTGGVRQGGDAGGQRSDSDEEDNDSEGRDPTYQLSNSEDEDGDSDFSSDSTRQPSNRKDEIPMGLFNSRSINKKQFRISKLINKFNLKVLTLTETWVKPENGDQRLGKILPEEFKFYHQPRVDEEGKSEKRGGGVAILFSNDLQGRRVPVDESSESFKSFKSSESSESSKSSESFKSFESFEYVAADLDYFKWPQSMWTITVYRPPGEQDNDIDKFLEEFQNLLNKCPKNNSILITGDFNIWVNENSATENPQQHKFATRFKKLLKDNGFRQHVKEKTHKHNILDLVITRNVKISNLRVKKPKTKTQTKIDKETNEEIKTKTAISDHYAVIFRACPHIGKRKHTKSPDPPSKQSKDREE